MFHIINQTSWLMPLTPYQPTRLTLRPAPPSRGLPPVTVAASITSYVNGGDLAPRPGCLARACSPRASPADIELKKPQESIEEARPPFSPNLPDRHFYQSIVHAHCGMCESSNCGLPIIYSASEGLGLVVIMWFSQCEAGLSQSELASLGPRGPFRSPAWSITRYYL